MIKIARFLVDDVPADSLEFFGNIRFFKLHPSSEQWLQMKSSFDTSTKSGLQSNSISDCLPQPPNQYSYKKSKIRYTYVGKYFWIIIKMKHLLWSLYNNVIFQQISWLEVHISFSLAFFIGSENSENSRRVGKEQRWHHLIPLLTMKKLIHFEKDVIKIKIVIVYWKPGLSDWLT